MCMGSDIKSPAAKSWAFYLSFLSAGLWLIMAWLVHSEVFHGSQAPLLHKINPELLRILY